MARIRLADKRDLQAILAIDHATHTPGILTEDNVGLLIGGTLFCWVIVNFRDVIGFALVNPSGDAWDLQCLAIAPLYEFRNHDFELMAWIQRLAVRAKKQLRFSVSERNDAAHVFLKACGFTATACGECYHFSFNAPAERNRIAEYFEA